MWWTEDRWKIIMSCEYVAILLLYDDGGSWKNDGIGHLLYDIRVGIPVHTQLDLQIWGASLMPPLETRPRAEKPMRTGAGFTLPAGDSLC